jgi:hypothetical protein
MARTKSAPANEAPEHPSLPAEAPAANGTGTAGDARAPLTKRLSDLARVIAIGGGLAFVAIIVLAVSGAFDAGHKSKSHAASGSGPVRHAVSFGPAQPLSQALPPALVLWRFGGIPAGWHLSTEPVTRAARTAGGHLDFVTSTRPDAYQLLSRVVPLPAGRYVTVLRGRVVNGGIEVGVLNVATNHWIRNVNFRAAQSAGSAIAMPVAFAIPTRTRVELILSNYTPRKSASSHWLLRDISIRQGTAAKGNAR